MGIQIRDLIIELKQRRISVILSSHLLEQVQEVCDRVGIIFEGKLVKEGKLEELIEIESQTEIILEHAEPKILDQINELVQASEETRVLRSGKP